MTRIFLIYFQRDRIIDYNRFILRVTSNCARKIYNPNMIFAMCYDLTAKQLYEKLFINPDERHGCFVMEITNYYASLPSDIIDWLADKSEQAKKDNKQHQSV